MSGAMAKNDERHMQKNCRSTYAKNLPSAKIPLREALALP